MNEESMKQFRRVPQCVFCGAELVTDEAPCLHCSLKEALRGVSREELKGLAVRVKAARERHGWDKG